jgi:hypothetical protein
MSTTAPVTDQYQYVKMPDGSFGKFAASASDDTIRSAVQKDFPDAYKTDDRNSIQKSFDENTKRSPNEPLLESGLKSIVGSIGAPFVHPEQTLNSMGNLFNPDVSKNPIVNAVESVNQDYKQGGLPYAATNLAGSVLGGAALGEAGGAIPGAMRGAGSMLRSGAAGLDNAAIGASGGDMQFGANPGRAMSTNRVIGSNAASIAPKLRELIPGAVSEHRGIVAANPGGKMINAGPLVSDPFQNLIDAKTDPVTGAAAPSQIKRAGMTQRGLTHVPDSDTGMPTPMMRRPMLSPLEATELKSNIYDMTDYDNPSQSALSNKGLKGAAHNLKSSVEQAVPESVESGQRLHDLMAAKDILEPSARLVKLPTSKSGIVDRAATLGATTGAAGMDVAGSGLGSLGRFIDAAPLRPLGYAAADDRKKEKK